MKRLIDVICPNCSRARLDVMCEEGEYPRCEVCLVFMERVWSSTAHVHGDEIDITIKHGLCHEDGTPRRFTSREELNRAAKAAGYTNHVEHVPVPGSDKSPHTVRFVNISTISEEERIAHWHRHEATLQPHGNHLKA